VFYNFAHLDKNSIMNWFKIVNLIFIILIIIFQYQAWSGRDGKENIVALQLQVEALKSKNLVLSTENEVIRANIQDLRYGTQALEEIARSQLGLIREDEVFYFVAGSSSQ
jgi:cell division protein FtsB